MNQLSFIEALEPKRTEAAPLSKMELLAAGLSAQCMGQSARVEYLEAQVRKALKANGVD